MKTILIAISLHLLALLSSAQITFQKTFGGTNDDQGQSVLQTADGGYIITGNTKSFGNGLQDVYLIRTDAYGDTLWTRSFGESSNDNGYSAIQTSDSGYIIIGSTSSSGAGLSDVYLIKTDSNGNTLWTKAYGTIDTDGGYSVQQTSDGGYILGCHISFFGPISNRDIALIKTDVNGDTIWTKAYGGTPFPDFISMVKQTMDSGFIICGYTKSFGVGNDDIYIIKTDSSGNVDWSKTYGGSSFDIGTSIQQTNDSGYVITGVYSIGLYNYACLIKTNSSGDTLWTKLYSGQGYRTSYSFQQTTDGGYIIAGQYAPNAGTHAYICLLKTDANGDTLWTKYFGGGLNSAAYSLQQTFDGGYIITGITNSFGNGGYDVYLIKTDSLGNSGCNESNHPMVIASTGLTITTPATLVSPTLAITTIPATQVASGSVVTTLCTILGLNSTLQDIPKVSVTPNPFIDKLIVSMRIDDDAEILLYDIYSRIIFKQRISNSATLNTEQLAKGIYLYEVRNKNGVIKKGKVVKE